MQLLNCDSSHCCHPNFFSNQRNSPLSTPQAMRRDPRRCPMGDPAGRFRGQASNEVPLEIGPPRRRISVACSRCRKRKIRCSGDVGNGRCTSCQQAGVDPSLCQFYRVNSDDVRKVIDDVRAHGRIGMANASTVPIFSTNSSLDHQSMPMQHYHLLDDKSMYHSVWPVPYSHDPPSIDAYSLDHASPFLPHTEPVPNSQICEPPCRWNFRGVKNLNDETNVCFDSIPSYSAESVQPQQISPIEAPSPLSMASLQITLPERLRGRNATLPEVGTPQRILPFPQPSPAQVTRNVVDELQGRRLRSVPGPILLSRHSQGYFSAPEFSRRSYRECQISAPEVRPPVPRTSGDTITYHPTMTPIPSEAKIPDTGSQPEYKFSTSTLMDPITPPGLVTPYSNFRESTQSCYDTQLTRRTSHSELYELGADTVQKCDSPCGDITGDSALGSIQGCSPSKKSSLKKFSPKKSPRKRISSADSVHREPFETPDRSEQL